MKKPFNIDADPMNADWAKHTWDVDLPTNPVDMRAWLKECGMSVSEFRKSPLYQFNVEKMPWLKEV
jgi:hypothetical protein